MKRSAAALSIAMALASFLAACGKTLTVTLAPAPEDLFEPTAPIEVRRVYRGVVPDVDVAADPEDAFERGFVSGATKVARPIDPYLGVFQLMLAPVVGLVGGAYGAAKAHSPEEVEASVASLEAIYEDTKLRTALEDMVAQRLESHGFSLVSSCPAPEETSAAESLPASETSGIAVCEPNTERNRLVLHPYYGLEQTGTYSPKVRFTLGVVAEAAGPDAQIERKFRWRYRSPEFDFFHATKDGANLLRREIAQGQKKTADQIVEDLLVTRNPSKVTGKYYSDGDDFVLEPVEPGTVQRIPPHF